MISVCYQLRLCSDSVHSYLRGHILFFCVCDSSLLLRGQLTDGDRKKIPASNFCWPVSVFRGRCSSGYEKLLDVPPLKEKKLLGNTELDDQN